MGVGELLGLVVGDLGQDDGGEGGGGGGGGSWGGMFGEDRGAMGYTRALDGCQRDTGGWG
jgi:hypothetical protein